MPARPILRLIEPVVAERRRGGRRNIPRPCGPGRQAQGVRFQSTFDRLADAVNSDQPAVELRSDPSGIAPERALVFVVAGQVQGFAKVAAEAGLELISEVDLDATEDLPEGFQPAQGSSEFTPELYATMPTIESIRNLLRLWRAYRNGERAPHGAAPWWHLFNLLLDLRPWGPEDRFPDSVKAAIAEQLPLDDDADTLIEIEIWPTANSSQRTNWFGEVRDRIQSLNGRVIDHSSIKEIGFNYEAVLASLRAADVRSMLANPSDLHGLATLDGIQFILTQNLGQAAPVIDDSGDGVARNLVGLAEEAPVRVALFDGTPVAGHSALVGGVVIEDLHDLVRLSPVDQRYHATSMASLILRGDLDSDGVLLSDSRVVSVPILIDANGDARSPSDRLFVDLVHSSLVRLFSGDEPLAPDVFVVNFSVGIPNLRFAGRISALARLIDWWAYNYGVLFVISAGNIQEDLVIQGLSWTGFDDASMDQKRGYVSRALRDMAFDRAIFAPAESLNGLTVGALSEDLSLNNEVPEDSSIIRLERDGERSPQLTSALGLGPFRSIKPDFIMTGGAQEFRAIPTACGVGVRVLRDGQRTGLVVASPRTRGVAPVRRTWGTSSAAALATRAILNAANDLISEEGPYQGQELSREDLALLTRALAVNSAQWTEEADSLYREILEVLGSRKHSRAKEEVARQFGHGILNPQLMTSSPENGVTLVGLGQVRKDQAKVFEFPLPSSMSGDRVARSMQVTLAWFSPIDATRGRYRLAGLEAVACGTEDGDESSIDSTWGLMLGSDGPESNMIKRGTVWSKRLVHNRLTVPGFNEGESLPIRVQCRDAADGALNPDKEIRFAIAVTLAIESAVQYDVYDEVRSEIAIRLRGRR